MVDFWKFKNSYGADWGENGYARIIRGVAPGKGCYGILSMASTALTSSYPGGRCLKECAEDEECCFGDCLKKGGDKKCCEHTGSCPNENICCGDTGAN